MHNNELIQVAVLRTVKPGYEKEFEKALHNFVRRSLTLPGQMGVSVVRLAPDSAFRHYGIIRKFADRDALAAFRVSPEYLEWTRNAQHLTEGDASVEELTGLES